MSAIRRVHFRTPLGMTWVLGCIWRDASIHVVLSLNWATTSCQGALFMLFDVHALPCIHVEKQRF